MQRRWSFTPSRLLDGLLVVFAANGLLVASSIVARYATADDDPPAQPASNIAVASNSGEASVASSSAITAQIPPPPEVAPPSEQELHALLQNSQFRDFIDIAAEKYPEYLGQNRLADQPPSDPQTISASSGGLGHDKLRDLEERLLAVADLNQAALRLTRIAQRHAAAERTMKSQEALQLSQQLQAIAARLLQP
jgi:hypothetical protein